MSVLTACAPKPESAAPSSILLVTLGGLRADDVLPRLAASTADAWTGRAVVASSDPSSALFSLMTGTRPWQHGLWTSKLPRQRTMPSSLAEELSHRGRRAAAVIPSGFQRQEADLAIGFERLAAPALGRLEREIQRFEGLLWIHFEAAEISREAARNPSLRARARDQRLATLDRRLDRLVAAVRNRDQWEQTLLIVTGSPGPIHNAQDLIAAEGLERSALEVPLIVKPAKGSGPIGVPAGIRVAQTRLWSTMAETVGLRPSPARAPSLFRDARPAILSELYLGNGINRFSLLDGDLQLLWTTPFTTPREGYARALISGSSGGSRALAVAETLRHLRVAFRQAPPLQGIAELGQPSLELVRWNSDGTTEDVEDHAALERLSNQLVHRWSRFQPRHLPPLAESRIAAPGTGED